jgi:hypothetical protein
MPPEGCSHARGHTMPFVASEIFGCEMQTIMSRFFTTANRVQNDFTEQQMTPLSSFQELDDPFESMKYTEPSKFVIVPTEALKMSRVAEDDGVEMEFGDVEETQNQSSEQPPELNTKETILDEIPADDGLKTFSVKSLDNSSDKSLDSQQ